MTSEQSIDCNHSSAEDAQDALESSVTKLLRHLPERWAEFSPDDLSAQETTALAHLVAAEMVERRIRFRLRMLNQSLAVEAMITATGEYGLVEALEALAAGLWEDWRSAFAAWHARDTRDATARSKLRNACFPNSAPGRRAHSGANSNGCGGARPCGLT